MNANNDKLIQSCQQEKLTNLIYADENRSAKHKLGNNQPGDGWRFRGRGMIQLTGRDNYTNVYNVIKEISPADILSDQGALAIEQQTSLAVLTSMGYWKYKKVEKAANRQKNVDIISKAIGSDVDWSGKAKSFKDVTSILFKVDQCQWGGGSMSEDINNNQFNQYRIDIDLFKVEKISTNESSKKYQYLIYKNNIAIKTYILDKNNYGWLPFPETGNNWGRFGSRDTGGDNFIEEYVCAILFGFFYSLPDNGFSDTLYYNDINANDGRNIGHAGHRNGNDIDIRYPGSTNKAGGIKWSQAMKAYNSEKDFIDVLENILGIAKKWGFNKNYAYKIGIKYTTGAAIAVHQDHFHLGYRK